MEALNIYNNLNFLRQRSKEVDLKHDKTITQDIKILKKFCMENDAFAMAAVQLGIDKRILYVCAPTPDVKNKDESLHFVMINPVIIERKGKTTFWESCFSCFPYCGLVERPYKMKIKYFTPKDEERVQDFEGFVCTVLSHEIDHFDGIFHMDRAIKTLSLSKEERCQLREKEPYTIISKDCDFEYAPLNKEREY